MHVDRTIRAFFLPIVGTAAPALRGVAIFKADTLRIEPYNPAPAKVMPLE